MLFNGQTQIPTDQLLQRLIDFKIRKSKRMQSKKDSPQQIIAPIPQQIQQEKKKLQSSRSKKDMSKFFFYNRKPFLSTSDLQNPKVAFHSQSPQNHTNIHQKVTEFDVNERRTMQMSQHLNERQNAQAMNFQLTNILSKIENSEDAIQRFQTIAKGFANILVQLFDQFQKNCYQDLRQLWDQNQNCLIQIMLKPDEQKQKDQTNQNLSTQNKKLKSIITSHTSLLSKLRNQFDNLQRQINEQKPINSKIEIEPQNGLYLGTQALQIDSHKKSQIGQSGSTQNASNGQTIQNGHNGAHSMVKQLKIGANLEDIRVEQNFQEEFMSKFNEFSLSWRNAAMQLKH